LIPLNNNTLFHPNESRITTGSPRRSVGGAGVLSSQRGSAQGGERSVFLGTINSLASRFHSTQRSAKNQITIQDDNEEEMIKVVEQELPLKFKNFGNSTFKTGESQFTTIFSPQKSSSMRTLKEDFARLSV
jgi:mannose/fructose/N-acetylgalactosamine-specific phosphotransferase system component IIB